MSPITSTTPPAIVEELVEEQQSQVERRQQLASELVDLALERAVQQLKDADEVTPAMLTAALKAASALGVDLTRDGLPTSPTRDRILDEVANLDMRELM